MCYPGWCTGYEDYKGTCKAIVAAIKGIRDEVKITSVTSAQTAIGFAAEQNEPGQPTARIGFSAESETDSKAQTEIAVSHSSGSPGQRLRQQMIIVAIIGISSLLILVVARNYTQPCPEAVATLSQLRDFVSGSVGFLTGHAGAARSI